MADFSGFIDAIRMDVMDVSLFFFFKQKTAYDFTV